MAKPLRILENVRIASPCDVPWSSMAGDERTRYCGECEKRVHNLIGMSDTEIAALFAAQGTDLCIRLYERRDGTLMAEDCPNGLLAARRRLRRAIGALGAAAAVLLTAGLTRSQFARGAGRSLADISPFRQIANWFAPAPITITTPTSTRLTAGRMRVVPTIPNTQSDCDKSEDDKGGAS
ncbi:MAG TPA: hypothetical protein P5081_06170 [Phycisphaerae bacterium]|nr:hypothetical protein [Phycisphaerae bacterium]HRW52454.1 hypothetical protein [Phycisphaerae bacterium]